MILITRIARWTRRARSSAVTRLRVFARAAPWLVEVILANPAGALARWAVSVHDSHYGPVVPLRGTRLSSTIRFPLDYTTAQRSD